MMKKMRLHFAPVGRFVQNDIRRLFRDPSAMFFTFLFPIVFLGIFGSIFGNRDRVEFTLALINNSESFVGRTFDNLIRKEDLFNFVEEDITLEDAKERLRRNEINAILLLPEDFGQQPEGAETPEGEATLLYDQSDLQAGLALTYVFDGVFKEVNQRFAQSPNPFKVKSERLNDNGLREFDYIFSGVLGFTILTLATTTPSTVFPRRKQAGILRRYHTTPITKSQYFMANILSNIVVGLLAVTTMIIFALLFFDLDMNGSFVNLAAFVALSSFTLFGLGMAIGGWVKTENQAVPLSNLITFPMMFLAGTFFPRFLMPEWLQMVSSYLPLTPIIDGSRFIITEGRNLSQIMPEIGLLLGWAVVIYFFAIKAFRWE